MNYLEQIKENGYCILPKTLSQNQVNYFLTKIKKNSRFRNSIQKQEVQNCRLTAELHLVGMWVGGWVRGPDLKNCLAQSKMYSDFHYFLVFLNTLIYL